MSYTLTDAQVANLKTLGAASVTAAQAMSDAVNAIVVDPVDAATLQQELDAANAQITTLTTANAALTAHLTTLGADIDAVLAAAQKAKADE